MSTLETYDKYYEHACELVISDLMSAGFRGRRKVFPSRVMIIGAGGTSSWFAPKFAKIVNDAIRKDLIPDSNKMEIIYADGDSIEEKNLIRQNFVEFDIGKNKAEVISTRYGSQFNQDKVDCKYVDKYITNSKYRTIDPEVADKFLDISQVYSPNRMGNSNILFINLIDNAVTRKIIHLTAMDCSRAVVLDVANNEHNGQLTSSVYSRSYISSDIVNGWFYNSVPEQLTDTDDVSVFSCADSDADSVDQLFNANDMAATVLANYINTWIVERKMDNARVDFTTGARASITSSIPLLLADIIDPRYFEGMDGPRLDFINQAIDNSGLDKAEVLKHTGVFLKVKEDYRKRILDSL